MTRLSKMTRRRAVSFRKRNFKPACATAVKAEPTPTRMHENAMTGIVHANAKHTIRFFPTTLN